MWYRTGIVIVCALMLSACAHNPFDSNTQSPTAAKHVPGVTGCDPHTGYCHDEHDIANEIHQSL